MEKVKVTGYGPEGSYVELADGVEIREESGNPDAEGEEWSPSRWELWDGDELVWCFDYSGMANAWESDPKESAHRKIKEFAALYSLGKRNAENLDNQEDSE